MIIRSTDHTRISFGKLSDDGVLKQSPLASAKPDYNQFTSANFQYIVDHIGDMFGYAHVLIRVSVNANDLRTSTYGKHFMYQELIVKQGLLIEEQGKLIDRLVTLKDEEQDRISGI